MNRNREQLREDLIAVLAAGRELDPADDVHLADVFLDEMEATERWRTVGRKPRAPGYLVLLLAGALGLGSVLSHDGQRAASPSPRSVPMMAVHGQWYVRGICDDTALMLRVGH